MDARRLPRITLNERIQLEQKKDSKGTPAVDNEGFEGVWVTGAMGPLFIRKDETVNDAVARKTAPEDKPAKGIKKTIQSAKRSLYVRAMARKIKEIGVEVWGDMLEIARDKIRKDIRKKYALPETKAYIRRRGSQVI